MPTRDALGQASFFESVDSKSAEIRTGRFYSFSSAVFHFCAYYTKTSKSVLHGLMMRGANNLLPKRNLASIKFHVNSFVKKREKFILRRFLLKFWHFYATIISDTGREVKDSSANKLY